MTDPTELSPQVNAVLAEADWLRRVARSLVDDEGQALDLSQDVLHDAVRARPGLRGERLRAWLITVARRKASRQMERERARPDVEREAAREENDGSGEAAAERRVQLHMDLAAEIQALEPEARRILVEHYLDGRSQADLARAKGLSPAAVRKQVSRARARLRKRLDASDRGREGWSLALGFLARDLPLPAGPAVESFAPTPAGGKIAGTSTASVLASVPIIAAWMKPAWGLGVASLLAVALVHFRSSPITLEPAAPRLSEAPDAVELADLPLARLDEPQGAREVAAVQSGSAAPPESAPPVETSRWIRVVDEDQLAIPEARAVWIHRDENPAQLTLDADGYAAVEGTGSGRLLAAAPGYEGNWKSLDSNGRAGRIGAQTFILRTARTLAGRITVDGVAPGRDVPLFQWRSQLDLGLRPHDTSGEETERWLGLHQKPMPTADENGHFAIDLFWNWKTIHLKVPPRYAIRSCSGRATSENSLLLAVPGADQPCLIDLAELPHVFGRLVWGDSGEPVTGVLTYACNDENGDTELGSGWDWLSSDGEFSASGEPSAAHQIQLALEEGAPDFSHVVTLEGKELPLDLGTIVVQRHPEVQVLVREARFDGAAGQPIQAALRAGESRLATGADGRATVRADLSGRLEVFAVGYRAKSVELSPALAAGEVVIELERGVTLEVDVPVFPPGTSRPLLSLEWKDTPFETAYVDSDGRWRPYDFFTHRALYGLGFFAGGYDNQDRPGTSGGALFIPPRNGHLRIGSLLPAKNLRVQLTDCLWQPIYGAPLTLMEGTNRVDLREGWDDQALLLKVRASIEDGAPVTEGRLFMSGSANHSQNFLFQDEPSGLGPFMPGTYEIMISAKGVKTRTVEFELTPDSTVLEVVLQPL